MHLSSSTICPPDGYHPKNTSVCWRGPSLTSPYRNHVGRPTMSTHEMTVQPLNRAGASRDIVFRTRGHSHGAITRLVSPGDVGELIKPFVFLDYFDADAAHAPAFGYHPHSGIATLTLILSGEAFYKE